MAMRNAELLHKFSSGTCKGVTEVLNDVRDVLSWTEKEYILDVGCGTGNVTTNVVMKYVPPDAKVVATDISPEMIEFAEKQYNNHQITFKTLDILDDNLLKIWQKEQFTKVFCFYVMQRIMDDRRAYKNMFNLLKSEGEILLLFPTKHKLDVISPHLANIPKYSDYSEEINKMKFHIAPKEDHASHTSELLRSIGFDVVLCKYKTITPAAKTLDDFLDLFGLASRLSQILPEDLFKEALKDTREIVKKNHILETDDKGGYVLDYEALIVVAKKSQK